jgi:tRNA(fMet)-specific endonuclease VapC
MKYMLDTNICIYIIKRKPEHVLFRLQRMRLADIGISAITLSELECGVCKSARREENHRSLAEFVAPLEVLPYDDAAASAYGALRAGLESAGRPMGSLDMLIAAHAFALGRILVTNDEKEFRRVPGLIVQNWAAAPQS